MKLDKKTVFCILFGILIATYIWFLMPCGLPVGKELEKADWLSFWGSFVSFSGTITLGIVAWKQTQNANQIAEEAQQLSKKTLEWEFEKSYPYVMVKTATLVRIENTQINPDVLKTDQYRVSTVTPISGENKGIETNIITLFFYDSEKEAKLLKEFAIQITFENLSEKVIQSICVEKITANLFVNNSETTTTREYNIKSTLNESNAILPHKNMFFNIVIASNCEYLNSTIFQHPTAFTILLKVKTLKSSYFQEVKLDCVCSIIVSKYKFNIKY